MITLQNGPVVLRALTPEDAPDLARLANNKKIWDNVRDYFPHPYSEADAVAFITLTGAEAPLCSFAVTFENRLAGMAGIVPQSDVYRYSAEIGYWLGEPFWGRGIITTAVRLVTTYAFETLHFVRLYAGVFEYNDASMRVLRKCGFKQEAVFEKAIFKNKRFWNEHRFAQVR